MAITRAQPRMDKMPMPASNINNEQIKTHNGADKLVHLIRRHVAVECFKHRFLQLNLLGVIADHEVVACPLDGHG